MKITEIKGDLLADLKQGDTLAHGVNCKGVMGAGIAKPIREMFPENYKRYVDNCQGGLRPGSVLYVKEKGVGIYNLATQFRPGPDAHILNIRSAVQSMLIHAAIRDEWVIKTVRLGCGLGGLNWKDVKPELEKIDHPVELQVYFKENK